MANNQVVRLVEESKNHTMEISRSRCVRNIFIDLLQLALPLGSPLGIHLKSLEFAIFCFLCPLSFTLLPSPALCQGHNDVFFSFFLPSIFFFFLQELHHTLFTTDFLVQFLNLGFFPLL